MLRAHRRPSVRALVVSASVLTGTLAACGSGSKGEALEDSAAQRACAALAGHDAAGVEMLAADVVQAEAPVPPYCRVAARVDGRIRMELRFPHPWNGKLHHAGGGGYNGSIPPLTDTSLGALVQGYASVASDSGHQGEPFDASWALDDVRAAQLFGSESIPRVQAVAIQMIRTAVGQLPSRSYFEGCSGGGREALMMAQRHPSLFDGVIARAPAYGWTAAMGAFNRMAKALAVLPGGFSDAKVATLSSAIRQACDAQDGLVDGVVGHPTCLFDPQQLRCAGGSDAAATCLSDGQLAALTAWTTETSFGAGTYRYPGWAWSGQEDHADNWSGWVSGRGNVRLAGQYLLQDTTVKSYLARDPASDSLAYTPFDRDPAALAAMAALNDATEMDLGPFAARGAKLLLWHGSADAVLSPRATTAYFEAVTAAAGGPARAEAFVRYYLAPGVNHCGGGAGADQTDLLTTLDAWVSLGSAPGTLTAYKRAGGNVLFSRPLCVWPRYARYIGAPNDAAAAGRADSFTCAVP
jgi:hypothetical protein